MRKESKRTILKTLFLLWWLEGLLCRGKLPWGSISQELLDIWPKSSPADQVHVSHGAVSQVITIQAPLRGSLDDPRCLEWQLRNNLPAEAARGEELKREKKVSKRQ